jgi:hypothetical protein
MTKAPAKPSAKRKKSAGELFALVVHASAAPEQESYPPGQRHMLIVIVRGNSVEDALTTAVEGMVNAGWRDHEIAQASQLSPDLDRDELGQLGPSVADAEATGLSITVLADPITDKRH